MKTPLRDLLRGSLPRVCSAALSSSCFEVLVALLSLGRSPLHAGSVPTGTVTWIGVDRVRVKRSWIVSKRINRSS
jgi:hypothetical protein